MIMHQARLFCIFAFSLLICCKSTFTVRQKLPNEQPSKAVSSHASSSFYTKAPTVSGELLKISAIEKEETHVVSMSAIKITAMKDTEQKADFVRIWVCEKGNDSNCTVSRAKPMESASGVFFIYQIPAQEMTISAIACAETKALITTEIPCGAVTSSDYVSSVIPLNSPKNTEVLQTVQVQQDNILQQCAKIYSALDKYLMTDSEQKNADIEAFAKTQSGLSNEQICAEYMSSITVPPAQTPDTSTTASKHSEKDKSDFWIALSLEESK
jgi:hypothetical protein